MQPMNEAAGVVQRLETPECVRAPGMLLLMPAKRSRRLSPERHIRPVIMRVREECQGEAQPGGRLDGAGAVVNLLGHLPQHGQGFIDELAVIESTPHENRCRTPPPDSPSREMEEGC